VLAEAAQGATITVQAFRGGTDRSQMQTADALKALMWALDFERRGEEFYREAGKLTADPTGKQVFAGLANDERAHASWIQRAIDGVQKGGSYPDLQEGLEVRRLGAVRPPDFPAAQAYAAGRPNAHQLDALKRGIQTEVESRDFYAQAAQLTDDPAGRAMFAKLAEVEEEHRFLLKSEYDYLTKTGMYFGVPEFSVEALPD